MKMNIIEGKRGRKRSKKYMIGFDWEWYEGHCACVGDVENRDEWRFRTRMAEPK
jgi:hypothetical protein